MRDCSGQYFEKYHGPVICARDYVVNSLVRKFPTVDLINLSAGISSSLLCYLPFWLSQSSIDIDHAAQHVARINVAAVLAAGIIESVLDNPLSGSTKNQAQLTPMLLSIGDWINDYASKYGWQSASRLWMDKNCAALIIESQAGLEQRAFRPYYNIGDKYCFALFSSKILSPSHSYLIKEFIFLFQFFDEYIDIFSDVASHSHNDLLLILSGRERDIFTHKFKCNFTRTGDILIRRFRRMGITFEESGFNDLSAYCLDRIPFLETQMQFATL